jgi:hypothetical protein
MDDYDNIDVGGGWNPADVSPSFGNDFWGDIGDIDVKYGSIDVPDLSTLPGADYSNEGRNYPTPESTVGPGGSPVNAGVINNLPVTSVSGANNLAGLKNLFKAITGGSGTDAQISSLIPLLGALYAANQSNNRTQPSGYQGGIPRYTATRQTPAEGRQISGNVTFTPKAAGGGLKAGGFIIPADVVSHFGNGSSDAGLKALATKLGATPIKGSGDGMSDSIPTSIDGKEKALVAHEEAYLSPEKVARIGNGDQAKGAKKLRDMMARIREARTGTTAQGKQIDPSKFMPGGEVKRFEAGGATGVGAAAGAGVTGTESNLSNWAGPYVTDMLAKGQALSEMPFEQYSGPLTAGASNLQNKVFTGLQEANFPGNLGQSFSSATAPTIGADGQPGGPQGIAASYMNPYLSAVLNPQLEEMRRQAKINQLQGLGAFTKSGAFGGGRQAIMESETARNLAQEQNKAIAQGYSSAYDKAMGQFNTEQQQAKTLVDLMSQQGAAQRGITAEDIAANKAQFEEARVNPYKMVQFQQSLLSGLPLAAQTYNMAPTNNLSQFMGGLATANDLLKILGQVGDAATTVKP